MELRRYLLLVWRWSWLLTLAVVLGAAAAYGVSRLQTPAYVAQATILVNQAQAVTGPTYNDVLANQQLSKTYSQLVTSGPVLDRVAAQFDIPYETLERKVSAKVRRDTQLIDIRARDADAERAAAIANAIATVFAEQIRQAQLGQQSTAESDLQAQVDALQASITDKQREVSRLSAATPAPADADRQQNLVAAQGQLDSLRQNLAAVQRRLQDLRIDLARSINSVTIAHPARAPKRPAAPLVLVNTALGAALGLLMAGGFVALRAYLDDTVKNAGDVTRAAGAAVLGAVAPFSLPRRGRRAGDAEGAGPALPAAVSASVADAYRIVRTNLEFVRAGRGRFTVLVTSAKPEEGKSTTSANLAVILAQTGRRVALVDADMRRPSLHKVFGLPNKAGLSSLFLMDDPQPAGLLNQMPYDNLRVLTSGPLPPNPTELLASPRMERVLAALKDEAEIVVFDSPPLLGAADASVLAAQVDGVVLVVDAGRTRSGSVAMAATAVRRAQAPLWGVVLNKLRSDSDAYYDQSPYYGARQVADDPSHTLAAFRTAEEGARP